MHCVIYVYVYLFAQTATNAILDMQLKQLHV